MSDPNRPLGSRLKGNFKALYDRFSESRRPPNENLSTGSRRSPEFTSEAMALNVLQGAHNFIIKDSNFYIAQNMEFHQHSSSGQDDVLPVPQKPNSSALFTGREDIIEKLKNHFAPQDQGDKQRKSFLLYGIGGIGKTQICLKFVEEMADRFFHVFWIDASSEDTITLSLKGLCFHPDAKAAISLSSVSSQSALAWISSLQTEWLLVFDNADGRPEVVEKFLPSGLTGNILVTSRNKSLGRVTTYENSLEVCQMSQNEATLLLLKASDLTRTSGNVNDVAQRIVNELCCLPLAVDQAGAAIEAGISSIDNYLENLSQHRVRLMNHTLFKGASQYNHTVHETWDLSVCEIESRAREKTGSQDGEAAQVAILILQTAAFFHHENILEAMFREASTSFSPKYHKKLNEKIIKSITQLLQLGEDQPWNYISFHEGIRVLRSFSLIKEGPSSGIYSIHPLMHKWSRDRMEMAQKQVMHKVAKLILVHSIPLGAASLDLAFRRILSVHIKSNHQFQQENHIKKEFDELEYVRYSHVLQENGMWKDAEDVQYQVMKTTKTFGEMRQSTLTSMANLASTFVRQGKFDEAEKLLIQVLNLCTMQLGLEHPDTLTNMNNLAFTFSKQGNLEEAEKLNKQVLNLRTKLVGPEHPDTLISMTNLAFTFSEQGKYEEAEKLNTQVLNLRTKLLGPQHPNTLISMNNLAVKFSEQGKFEEAEKLNMQALDLRRTLLGPEHPHTLDSMNFLALTFSKQGNFEEAEKLNMQVLNLGQKLQGPHHPNTLINMNNLALNFSEQGKFEEAEKLNMQVLNLRTKLLGPQHPDTLASMNNLAVKFSEQGKFEEAEKLNMQTLDLRRKLLGLEHLHTLDSMNILAITFSKQEKFEEAKKLNMQVLNLRTKLLGPQHPDTLASMNNLAFIFSEQGNFEEAERLNMQVLNLHRKLLGPEHPDTLVSMSSLALSFSKHGKFEEAEKLNMQVLNLRQRLLGSEHLHTLDSMKNLAITFSK
ncbi:hypothetical protein K443DRAFT_15573 [Laccaria amethystina LaAM-08-1]|uniref:NB-ARC domain-containing protein n=1 Tax=Laccaria amethystina LaAM-08-1 TaxID=1095629 RepID=A0A0C9WGU2_9AGAR|nr:hypothetical protein K443DRAFT_15573 [Laccaria amethystina LaAM-08-1]